MDFPSLFDQIDAELENNARLTGTERSYDAEGRVWTKDRAGAKITPSGSTGIAVALLSSDRIVHERIYAASPMSVPRIARMIIEHLTGYAAT